MGTTLASMAFCHSKARSTGRIHRGVDVTVQSRGRSRSLCPIDWTLRDSNFEVLVRGLRSEDDLRFVRALVVFKASDRELEPRFVLLEQISGFAFVVPDLVERTVRRRG